MIDRTHIGDGRGPRVSWIVGVLLLSAALWACSESTPDRPDPRLEAQTYRWCAQPIRFSPLGPPWEAGRNQQGGRRGVSFIAGGSPPSAISIAEAFFLGDQDRTAQLRHLRDNLARMDRREFSRAIALARPSRADYHTPAQTRIIQATSGKLDDALSEYFEGYPGRAVRAVNDALRIYAGLTFSIDDVVERIEIDPETYPRGVVATIQGRTRRTLAGLDAVQIDYTLDEGHRTSACREIYLVVDTYAFVFHCQGPPEVLETFESVLETVAFPSLDPASAS